MLEIHNCSAADYDSLASDGEELYEFAESFEFCDFDYTADGMPFARFYDDDRSDDLTLIVGGGYTLNWFDSDEYTTILDVEFDTFEAALREYKAIMQGYER